MQKLSRSIACLLLLCAAGAPLAAQETGTIQGMVVEAQSRQPIAAARVSVEGTVLGTATAADGSYTLRNVPAGARTVRVQLIGYAAAVRQVSVPADGAARADFALATRGILLDEMVVTALGIPREEREISTSVQQVRGEELARAGETNLVTGLSGRVSGVTITNSNTPGGSARIVIRGSNSLTGNNQPLFIVDGVPVINTSGGGGRVGYNAIDYGNAIADLNPNDIESVTVLKGPTAAALYGSRAANGAVIVTTKSGRGTASAVSASSLVTFETPLLLPTYQNLYGQGANGQYRYENGRGGGRYDDADESWGPRLDGQLICQFNSPRNADGTCVPTPWVAQPNNVRDFFETGRTVNTSAAFSTSREGANVRISLANLNQDGMYPGFGLERTTGALNGRAELSERLSADASLQYINTDGRNRPAQGYGIDNVMWQFLWFGRQVDTRVLRDSLRRPDGSQFSWNSRWNNSPYWTTRVNQNRDSRDRIIGSGSLSYEFTPWLSGMVRSGTDWYQENRRRTYMAGTVGTSSVGANGAFSEDDQFQQEMNTDFLLTARAPEWNQLGVTARFGGNRRDYRYRSTGAYVRDLVVPGLFDLGNAAVTPDFSDWREATRVNSLYGAVQAGYRDLAFVEATARNDWSSTLPASSDSYFYPSLSANVIFTQLVDVPFVSYGKLRAAWAEVGNDTGPYQLLDPYIADAPFGSFPRFTGSNRLRNNQLLPERTAAREIGLELRGPADRYGLDVTFYQKNTSNQIVGVNVTPMTGFTERVLNAGEISNRGVELLADATPVRLANGFEWTVSAAYSRNRSRVESLHADLERIVLGNYYGVSVEARVGEPYGVMYGRMYVRDSQGRIVLGSNGLPLNNAATNPIGRLGQYEPDWSGGLTNRFTYAGVELNVLLDGRFGGVLYSNTNNYGRRSGVLIESLEGREESHDQGIVVPGVRVVNGDTIVNDVEVTAVRYHKSLRDLAEEFTYDATFVKLREVRLGYSLPSGIVRRARVEGVQVALIGRNLALWTDVPNIDPETAFNAGNVQGFEYSQMPSGRSVGFSISVTP